MKPGSIMIVPIGRLLHLMNPMVAATFLREYSTFRSKAEGKERFQMSFRDSFPIMDERVSGTFRDHHYLYHLAWGARMLEKISPSEHVDISSHVYFPALMSARIPTTFCEYQPSELSLSGMCSKRADVLNLPFDDDSIPSLSCMHVMEHIGLGRYGDPLDYDGDLKACSELSRVLAPGGNLLFVVPVGRPRIQFNAHRIYSYEQVVSMFPNLTLQETALITDEGKEGLIENADPKMFSAQSLGCGCFRFSKPLKA